MARTKGVSSKPEAFIRAIEYEDAHIGKTASGKIYAVFNLDTQNETRTLASDVSDAKHIIDSTQTKSRAVDNPRQRGRRTKGARVVQFNPEKYKHLSRGGYRMCPPDDCPHKCHWEGDPAQLFWVDNIVCAGRCKKSEHCEHFKEFMRESKKRIKLQTTHRMEEHCQYCKAAIETIDAEGSGTYKCGTSYNRLEGEYTQVCKPAKKSKKQEEIKPKKRGRTK